MDFSHFPNGTKQNKAERKKNPFVGGAKYKTNFFLLIADQLHMCAEVLIFLFFFFLIGFICRQTFRETQICFYSKIEYKITITKFNSKLSLKMHNAVAVALAWLKKFEDGESEVFF